MSGDTADAETLEAIRRLATEPDRVRVTQRAEYDLLAEGLTKDDICDEIIAWIDAGKDVEAGITNQVETHYGEAHYVLKPSINGKTFYVKVTILHRDEWREELLLISNHPSN